MSKASRKWKAELKKDNNLLGGSFNDRKFRSLKEYRKEQRAINRYLKYWRKK